MSKEIKENIILDTSIGCGIILVTPLQMEWKPKKDITTYELALCMKYLVIPGSIMPDQINQEDKHLRHFKITDHNKKNK